MPTNDDEQMEIEELAKLMWASWGGSNYGEPWEKLDEPYKLKWRSQAELIIDNGYRKQPPESRKVKYLSEERLHELWASIDKDLIIGIQICRFIDLIIEEYGKPNMNLEPLPNMITEYGNWQSKHLNPYLNDFFRYINNKFGSPAIPSVEYILDLIESPMITSAKHEPVWWVSKGKKELAEAIHRLLTNGK